MANVRIVPATKTANTLVEGCSYQLVGEQVRATRFDERTSAWVDVTRSTLSTAEQLALRDRLVAKHPLPVPRPPEPTPVPQPTPPSSKTLLGLVAAPDWPAALAAGIGAIEPKLVRLTNTRMSLTSAMTAQSIAMVRAAGAEPILLWEDWTPSSTPATIRQWVDKFRLRYVEPGNEDFYNYGTKSTTSSIATAKATAYAKQIKAIHTALAGTGCQVLAQFDFPHWNGVEVTAIRAAVPDFPGYCDGITIHPYIDGPKRITTMLARWRTLGGRADMPTFATEWGIATDNGRPLTPKEKATGTGTGTVYGFPNDLTYEQAAGFVRPTFDRLASACNLVALCAYQDRDQREHGASLDPEHYFGLCTLVAGKPGPPKPFYADAVKALGGLAASLKTTG